MGLFRRNPEQPVTTVIDPSVATRLDEATQRLESVVHQLMERLDEFNVPQPIKVAPAKKVAKKAPRKES